MIRKVLTLALLLALGGAVQAQQEEAQIAGSGANGMSVTQAFTNQALLNSYTALTARRTALLNEREQRKSQMGYYDLYLLDFRLYDAKGYLTDMIGALEEWAALWMIGEQWRVQGWGYFNAQEWASALACFLQAITIYNQCAPCLTRAGEQGDKAKTALDAADAILQPYRGPGM